MECHSVHYCTMPDDTMCWGPSNAHRIFVFLFRIVPNVSLKRKKKLYEQQMDKLGDDGQRRRTTNSTNRMHAYKWYTKQTRLFLLYTDGSENSSLLLLLWPFLLLFGGAHASTWSATAAAAVASLAIPAVNETRPMAHQTTALCHALARWYNF